MSAKRAAKGMNLRGFSPEAAKLAVSTATLLKQEAKGAPARLRDLTPDQAEALLNRSALAVVRQAVEVRETLRRETKMADGPTLERLMAGDCQIAEILVPEEGRLTARRIVRAQSLMQRLMKAGHSQDKAWTGERFARDVEAMMIGNLTANYEGGASSKARTSAEPERMLIAMQRVHRATGKLTRKERAAAWGALVFGMSMTDLGYALWGGQFGRAELRLRDAAWLSLEAALERMTPFYMAIGE